MPQLDWTTYPSQLFWLFSIFCVLWGCMRYVALPPLERVLKKRRETLAQMLAETKALEEKRLLLLAHTQEALETTRRACEKEIEAQRYTHQINLRAFKKEQTAYRREKLKEINRTIARLQKEALEEGFLKLPLLEEVFVQKIMTTYTDERRKLHAS